MKAISKFELKWRELSLKNHPDSSHFEYIIDGVNLKDIIDCEYGYDSFVENNEFVGWIHEQLDPEELEQRKQILKGEKVDDQTKFPIYTCECGDIGCGGLEIHFQISDGKITWSFDDGVMAPMVFDLDQYRSEIDLKIKSIH